MAGLLGMEAYLSSQTALSTQLRVLGFESCHSLDGAASPTAVRLWRAWGHVQGPADMLALHSHTRPEGSVRISTRAKALKGHRLTYILLLLMHVTNLEPDIFLIERSGRILDDVAETLSR